MSQQVSVERELVFDQQANQDQNVKGDMNPERIFKEWNFQELALDGTYQYTMQLDSTSTIASGSGGAVMTTAATDTKNVELSCGGIWWYPAKNPVCEIKLALDVVTTVRINVGLTDAVSYGSSVLPFTINGTTITDNATNAVMFAFDVTQSNDYWYIVNTKAGAEGGTILASTILPVAAVAAIFRVKIDSLGNAWYYYNGVGIGYKSLATATATPLVPYIGIENTTGTAHIGTVRYVRCWQDS